MYLSRTEVPGQEGRSGSAATRYGLSETTPRNRGDRNAVRATASGHGRRLKSYLGRVLDTVTYSAISGTKASPAKRWKGLQLLLVHPRGVEPAAFGFCANEHISHKVKAPRANRPRGLHYLARPRGFEPLAFGFVAVQTSFGRRASLLGIPGFTRSWLRSRVHRSAPECTPVHARMDEIWMKCDLASKVCFTFSVSKERIHP